MPPPREAGQLDPNFRDVVHAKPARRRTTLVEVTFNMAGWAIPWGTRGECVGNTTHAWGTNAPPEAPPVTSATHSPLPAASHNIGT